MKYEIYASIFKVFILTLSASVFLFSCKTVPKDIISDQNKNYLKSDSTTDEVFRVLIISDRYLSSQMKFNGQLRRIDDEEGDKNTSNRLKEYDKIDETCEGVLTVWLYPDSGKLMRIRPKTLAPIAEVNSLIVEDLKRWNFEFNGDNKEPGMFDIRYRVVLRKMQSDEEIMKEVMERARKEEEKKASKKSDD